MCPCKSGNAGNPNTHNNQVRTYGSCSCYCHVPSRNDSGPYRPDGLVKLNPPIEPRRDSYICDAEPTLVYTTSDDGIWMFCGTCSFEHHLGFNPVLKTVLESKLLHDSRILSTN